MFGKKSLSMAMLLAGLAATPLLASAEDGGCTLRSLHGTYAYADTMQTTQGPASQSGEEYYDGAGHMKYFQFWNDGTNTYTYSGTGTYTIGANCMATVIYESDGAQAGLPWTYFVAPDGSGYYWNNNQGFGVISAGHVQRISSSQLLN